MVVSIKDIAAKVGVTDATVSMALRDSPEISIKRRNQIKAIAKEMNYIPNRLGRNLRNGRTHTIGLVLAWNQTQLMDTAEKFAHKYGFSLMVQFTTMPNPAWEEKNFISLLERQVDGIIWLPGNQIADRKQLIDILHHNSVNVVLLEELFSESHNFDCVWGDDKIGFDQSICYLKQQGYEEILYLTHDAESPGTTQRLHLFEQTAIKFGCPYSFLRFNEIDEEKTKLAEYFKQQNLPLGVICDGDFLGFDAIKVATMLGKNVPNEIGVICIGDNLYGGRYRINDWVTPKLTAIRQPYEKIAQKAVELLVDKIENTHNLTSRQYLIPPELIIRESALRLKNNTSRIRANVSTPHEIEQNCDFINIKVL